MSPLLKLEVVSLSEVPSNESAAHPERHRPVVMIVDDEHIIADTLSIILSKNGFAVLTAYDAHSALELARLVPPELLLSDIVMEPGMDGTELAIAVVASFPDCRVLLFSGNAATCDLLGKARASGYNFPLLTKPLHPAQLLARIAETFSFPSPRLAVA